MSKPTIGLVVIDPNARGLAAEAPPMPLRMPLRLRANNAAVIERLKLCVTLAHNLAIAAALTRAYHIGDGVGGRFGPYWRPNVDGTRAP